MIKNFKEFLLILPLVFFINASAQVEINGLVDFELSKGGKDSNFGVNEIPSAYKEAHLAINQMNLFIFSQITDDFSVNIRLQFDTWGTGTLNPLRLSLAELTWEPPEGSVRLSIGRFVNPFGLYPQRQLSIQNPVVNTPLIYGYAINITNQHGFWATDSGNYNYSYGYGSEANRLTTISYAGYTTGILFSWLIVGELLNIDLALTNVAPTSQKNYTNIASLAGITRVAIQPAIFWQQGISFSYGSFMESAEVNANFDDLKKYKQTIIGTDWVISYTYFELSGEYIYAFWKVPAYNSDTEEYVWDDNGDVATFELENYSFYADLKYEPPFLPGTYLAFRYEELHFQGYDHPEASTEISKNPWDDSVRRYTFGIGYKFSPDIQLKIAYSDQELITDSGSSGSYYNPDPDPVYVYQPEAYTLRCILSAAF